MPNDRIKFLEPIDAMKNLPCDFCGEQGIEVWVQINEPGGGMMLCHEKCLDKFLET